MNIISESDFLKMDINEQKQYIIDIVSSLSDEDAQELYNFMIGDEELRKELERLKIQ